MSELIAYESLTAMPWKNGGGSTTEIAVAPPGAGFDDFDWRISLATITQSGPFSVFPGIDRSLALVDGPGVTLDIDGVRRVALGEDHPLVEFCGEAEVQASVGEGATTDFNVMTRRGRCRHKLERRTVRGGARLERHGSLTVLFVADGDELAVFNDAERVTLVRYDALLIESGTHWMLEACQATVIVVEIFENRD